MCNSTFLRSIGLFLALLTAQLLTGQLVINELMADNNSTDYDDFFEAEDWVEIYNSGSIVNLAGYFLTDDPDSLNKWMFPETNPALTTVLPGGHVRIWCDKDPQQGEDHADFKLSADGESVFLVEPDGMTVVDQITFGPQASNISYGRSCDGCPDWVYFNVPTPDAPNSNETLPTQQLYFNEFQHLNETTIAPEAGPGGAWLEVYNPNPIDVNLAGYTIGADGANWTVPSDDPVRTLIPAEGFVLVWLSGETSWGADHASIAVGAGAPPLNWTLIGADGSVVDAVEWVPAELDWSYGRSTDGGPLWQTFVDPTPRVSNQTIIIPGANLVINELMSDNTWSITDAVGEHEDWFEVHNPTDVAVDLAGYYLSDSWNNPTKYRVPVGIPDSTTIPAGGFKLFWADEDGQQGWNHVNFRLSNAGEHLALRSPDGFSVVDSLNFPEVWSNFSYGRLEDAGLPWVFFEQSTPEASNNGASVDVSESDQPPTNQLVPNPVAIGRPIQVAQAGSLWSMNGLRLSTWTAAGAIAAPSAPGLYLIHWEGSTGGRPSKLLVL